MFTPIPLCAYTRKDLYGKMQKMKKGFCGSNHSLYFCKYNTKALTLTRAAALSMCALRNNRNTSGAYQGAKYFSYYGKVLDEIRKENEKK